LIPNQPSAHGNALFDFDRGKQEEKHLLTSASFFLTTNDLSLKTLLGIFNSSVFRFQFSLVGEKTAGGAYVFKKTTIEKLLLPESLFVEDSSEIAAIVSQIQSLKKSGSNADISELKSQIDHLVYQLYDLTKEEIEIIESAL
jgi:adenine-specific DNA-methyltransferase